MSNKFKNVELVHGNSLINESLRELLMKIPDTSSINFESELINAIKYIMEYDMECTRESIIVIIKRINLRINSIKILNSTLKSDILPVKKKYHSIIHTISEYTRHRHITYVNQVGKYDIAYEYAHNELNSPSNYRYGMYSAMTLSEEFQRMNYINLYIEIKKNEMALSLLKKIRARLDSLLSRIC